LSAVDEGVHEPAEVAVLEPGCQIVDVQAVAADVADGVPVDHGAKQRVHVLGAARYAISVDEAQNPLHVKRSPREIVLIP
jgi:hypothetical protein